MNVSSMRDLIKRVCVGQFEIVDPGVIEIGARDRSTCVALHSRSCAASEDRMSPNILLPEVVTRGHNVELSQRRAIRYRWGAGKISRCAGGICTANGEQVVILLRSGKIGRNAAAGGIAGIVVAVLEKCGNCRSASP